MIFINNLVRIMTIVSPSASASHSPAYRPTLIPNMYMDELVSQSHIPQICISRIDNNVSKYEIFKQFCRLKIGYIENISEFPIKDSLEYKRIVIKIKWNQSLKAKKFLERFKENKTVKVIYSNEPWFWVCKPFI